MPVSETMLEGKITLFTDRTLVIDTDNHETSNDSIYRSIMIKYCNKKIITLPNGIYVKSIDAMDTMDVQ